MPLNVYVISFFLYFRTNYWLVITKITSVSKNTLIQDEYDYLKISSDFARGPHEMQLNLQKERGFLPRISKNRYRISASEILLK